MRWRGALLSCALIVGLLLVGCIRADLRPLAVATLVNEAEELLKDAIRGSQWVQFDERFDAKGELAEDRFPDWARDQYDECVYWSDEFYATHMNGNRTSGHAWGWALINTGIEFHILEIAWENDETGETQTLVSAWEEPAPEEQT